MPGSRPGCTGTKLTLVVSTTTSFRCKLAELAAAGQGGEAGRQGGSVYSNARSGAGGRLAAGLGLIVGEITIPGLYFRWWGT